MPREQRLQLLNHRTDLLVMKLRLSNGTVQADPQVVPAAIWWLEQEVADINKTLEG